MWPIKLVFIVSCWVTRKKGNCEIPYGAVEIYLLCDFSGVSYVICFASFEISDSRALQEFSIKTGVFSFAVGLKKKKKNLWINCRKCRKNIISNKLPPSGAIVRVPFRWMQTILTNLTKENRNEYKLLEIWTFYIWFLQIIAKTAEPILFDEICLNEFGITFTFWTF